MQTSDTGFFTLWLCDDNIFVYLVIYPQLEITFSGEQNHE